MTIGMINNLEKDSGMGRYAFSLFDELKKICNVEQILLNYDKRRVEKINNQRKMIYKVAHNSLLKNAIIRDSPISKILFWKKVKNKIPKYALQHITNQNLSFIAREPFVITVHNLPQQAMLRNPFINYTLKYVYSGILQAERIITISKASKNDIIRKLDYAKNKIDVIYYGVNLNIFRKKHIDRTFLNKFKISNNYKYLLYVGDEQPRKNLIRLIKAFYQVKNKYGIKNLRLLKIGKPSFHSNRRKKILKLIKELKLEKDIIFMGHISDDYLLSNFYNTCDLFVFPSLWEGFGLPPLEAMACGKPVITSNISSLPEVVGNAAIKVNPYNVNEIAAAIYDVLNNKNIAEKLSNKAQKRAKLFSWEKVAKETLKVYEKIVG